MTKKMAIPSRSRKQPLCLPKIVFTVRPDGEIEWIGRFQSVIVWIRVKCRLLTSITEPVQIPIDAQEVLSYLKDFKNRNVISFIYDPDLGLINLIGGKEENSRELVMKAPTKSEVKGLLESFPFKVEKDTDIILFKGGALKPNIEGSCDVKIFKNLVKNAIFIRKNELSDLKENFLKRELKDKPLMYNIFIDSDLLQIKTVAVNGNISYEIIDILKTANVNGRGELHYTSGFAEVINVLSGEIKFYAVDNGPIWIMQDTNRMKLRYLIVPSTESSKAFRIFC